MMQTMKLQIFERFDHIREWAESRGLYDKGNSHTQYVKLQEEAGELAKALLKDDQPESYRCYRRYGCCINKFSSSTKVLI